MNILSYIFLFVFYGKNSENLRGTKNIIECKNDFDCRNSSSCVDGVTECICNNNKCYFD